MGKLAASAVGLVAVLALLSVAASASAAEASGDDASASIVKGTPARISKWPWQVALARNFYRFEGTSRQRTFCGGVVLAPRLILTARHCVNDGVTRRPRNLMVYAGRTFINDSFSVSINWVRRIVRAPYPSWDVALLRLGHPVAATPIRLADRSEYNTWKPGQMAFATGWGLTRYEGPMSRRLRVTRQVILPDGVCRRDRTVSRGFRPRLMVCHGSPYASGSTCNGDSGGPLVVPVRTNEGLKYRLAGLTFYGDEFCSPDHPSVASRVSGDRLRKWIVGKVSWLSPVDPVGSGASPLPPPDWCRVPVLDGLPVYRARTKLRQNGCYGARFEYTSWLHAPRRRVWATDPDAGWLLYPRAKFEVRVTSKSR